jgi:hypothetical protein
MGFQMAWNLFYETNNLCPWWIYNYKDLMLVAHDGEEIRL